MLLGWRVRPLSCRPGNPPRRTLGTEPEACSQNGSPLSSCARPCRDFGKQAPDTVVEDQPTTGLSAGEVVVNAIKPYSMQKLEGPPSGLYQLLGILKTVGAVIES